MIKTDNDILYNKIKNTVGFHRSKKFKDWFHKQYPDSEMHHVFGSTSQSLKTSDYCSVPVHPELHKEAEKNKSEFAIEYLNAMILVMIKYIIYLENK